MKKLEIYGELDTFLGHIKIVDTTTLQLARKLLNLSWKYWQEEKAKDIEI